MDRRYAAFTSATPPAMPAPGATGFPRGGEVGSPPTQAGPWWFHMITESLRNVIVAAGLPPDASDLTLLVQAIRSLAVPTGMAGSFAGLVAPYGWLIADGSAVSRTTYPALWAFAQSSGMVAGDAGDHASHPTKFYVGDGATTFHLPDWRGVVARGLDLGRGLDAGRGLGTYQVDDNKQHGHNSVGYGPGGGLAGFSVGDNDNDLSLPTSTSGGGEARMKNVALLPIIKC